MYKACIFDLDGTLVNTIHTVAYYSNQALLHFGFHEIPIEKFNILCRLKADEYYKNLLIFGGCPEEETQKYMKDIYEYDQKIYNTDCLYLTEPYEGIISLLQKLKSRGIILGVLTNKPAEATGNLVTALFPNIFDVYCGHTFDSISKPDPRSLLNLLDKLSVNKNECIYVGDTDIDMITAYNAEVFSIGVTWGYQGSETLIKNHANVIVNSPKEILAHFITP